jgi:hypothetical protein
VNEEKNEVESPAESTGEVPDLRASLESAYEAAEAPPAAEPAESSTPEAKESSGQPRAPDGKFAKKVADAEGHGASDAEAGATATGVAPEAAPVAQPVSPVLPTPVSIKPPASWKPAAREAWAMLPDHVKAEVVRREQETSRVLNETTDARKFRETFQQALAPYEQTLRAEGVEPARAVANILGTVQMLRSGSRQQAAEALANVVRAYKIPIDALDAALAGQPYQGPAQQGPVQDPRVDQLFAQIEQAKAQRAQQEAHQADEAVSQFGADKEFFDDVREDMADLIEAAERRGQKLDLEVAYQKALRLNDEIAQVMRQREEAKAVTTAKAATSKARAAASSVRSSGPPSPVRATSNDLRASLEAAWDDISQ